MIRNGDPIATPISQKEIVPGDTISLEISILETATMILESRLI
jgi:hypothetical protein